MINSPHFKFSKVLSSNAERTWRKRERSDCVCPSLANLSVRRSQNRFATLAVCQLKLELKTWCKMWTNKYTVFLVISGLSFRPQAASLSDFESESGTQNYCHSLENFSIQFNR
jgi:hypothetical protein